MFLKLIKWLNKNRRKIIDNVPPVISILNTEKCIHFWGILLHNNISWESHIDNVNRKISQFVTIMYNVWKNLTQDVFGTLFISFLLQ